MALKIKNWFVEKVGGTAITIILTTILTSTIGIGGTYFMGFISAPSNIQKLNEKRQVDSLRAEKFICDNDKQLKELILRIEVLETQIKNIQQKTTNKKQTTQSNVPRPLQEAVSRKTTKKQ